MVDYETHSRASLSRGYRTFANAVRASGLNPVAFGLLDVTPKSPASASRTPRPSWGSRAVSGIGPGFGDAASASPDAHAGRVHPGGQGRVESVGPSSTKDPFVSGKEPDAGDAAHRRSRATTAERTETSGATGDGLDAVSSKSQRQALVPKILETELLTRPVWE